MEIVIDGVRYVPECESCQGGYDEPEPKIVDCDGRGVEIGERVYVRQSKLDYYANLSHANRHGSLTGFGEGTLFVEFDDGRAFDFPTAHIRRNKYQV
jgi:hypothetical protein